jgi:hypothetical protein
METTRRRPTYSEWSNMVSSLSPELAARRKERLFLEEVNGFVSLYNQKRRNSESSAADRRSDAIVRRLAERKLEEAARSLPTFDPDRVASALWNWNC